MTPAWLLLKAHWQIALAALAITYGTVAWREHNKSEQARGMWAERYRVADSLYRDAAKRLAHTDTVLVQSIVRVPVEIERVRVLHDTVLAHLTDTVLVKQFITRTDSAIKACTELLGSCEAFRRDATATIAALKLKAEAKPMTIKTGCVQPSLLGFAAGAAADELAHLIRR